MRPNAPRVLHPVLDVSSLGACFGPADVRACGEPRGSDNGPSALSSAFEVPEHGLDDEPTLSGVRVRTFDDPVQVDRIRNDDLPQVHVCHATKVGGAPSDRQSIDPPEVPCDWRFLGQIAGTWPPNRVPFPALGHPDTVDYLTPEFDRLVHGPGDGIVGLYLDRDDCVQVSFSCA